MASSGTDTEMDSEYSSSWDGSPEASPREAAPAPSGPPAARPPLLNLRVPPLSLRVNLADLPRDDGASCDSAPSTARRMNAGLGAVPRLSLPSRPVAADASAAAASPPRTSRGAPSLPHPTPVPALPKQQLDDRQQHAAAAQPPPPPEQQPAGGAGLLSLDILSPALSLQPSQLQGGGGSSRHAQLAQHCASQLGVTAERLRFFALSEVAGPQHLPPGCSRAAVEVVDSGFSLAALEELVAENQRLKEAAAQAARQQQEQQGQQRPAGGAAAAAAEVAQLQAQLRQLQLDNGTLRQQLRLSESLRRKGWKALTELKQDFDGVIRMVLLERAKQAPPLPCEPRPAVGTPAALEDALQQL
ncbi:hypothetical protein ABPG75_008231 [Micractinium tetrahymenae]